MIWSKFGVKNPIRSHKNTDEIKEFVIQPKYKLPQYSFVVNNKHKDENNKGFRTFALT